MGVGWEGEVWCVNGQGPKAVAGLKSDIPAGAFQRLCVHLAHFHSGARFPS